MSQFEKAFFEVIDINENGLLAKEIEKFNPRVETFTAPNTCFFNQSEAPQKIQLGHLVKFEA